MIGTNLFCKKNIQAMRGIAIILVVIHHALTNTITFPLRDVCISLSHADVVIFLIISGFLYEKNLNHYLQISFGRFTWNKFQRLIIPYFFWSIILYLLVDLAHGLFGGNISNMLNQMGFPMVALSKALLNTILFSEFYVEHLWFLYVLFFIFIVSRLMNRANRLFCNWFCIIALIIAGSFVIYYGKPPYILNKTIYYVPDFLFGRLLFRKREKIPTSKTLVSTVFLFSLITILFFSVLRPALPKNSFRNALVYLFQHIQYWTEFFAALMLVQYAGRWHSFDMMETVGNNSFAIYLMHTPYIVPIVSKAVSKYSIIISVLLSVCLGIIIPLVLKRYVLNKTRFCNIILFGEQQKPIKQQNEMRCEKG